MTTTDTWGYLQENGSYNGLIGSILRNETDIGVAASFMYRELIPYLDYTIGVWKYR